MKLYGAIVENKEIIGFGHFEAYGEYEDGTKIYYRDEDEDLQGVKQAGYICKRVDYEGKRKNVFFCDVFDRWGYDDPTFEEYKETLKPSITAENAKRFFN